MSTLQASSVAKTEKSVNRPAAYRPRHRSGWKSLNLHVPGGWVFEHPLLGLAIEVDGEQLYFPTSSQIDEIARLLDDNDARFAEQCRLEKDAGVAAANTELW